MGFETGNLFDIWQDQALTAINVRLAGGTAAGTEVYAKIYSINTDPNSTELFTYEGESNPKVVTAANLNTNLILALQAPVNLTANTTYLAVVGSYGPGMVVANAGTSEEQTTFFLDMLDDTWYFQTGTPYVRLNFDPSAGIEETNEDVFAASVYPNPTSNSTSVNFTLNSASEVNVTVSDITGKVVEVLMNETSVSGEQKISFDASSYANGAYYVTIATEGSTVTKKFMKK
jgi:hypothetical protein